MRWALIILTTLMCSCSTTTTEKITFQSICDSTLYPSVRIEGETGNGSGTIIGNKIVDQSTCRHFVLTAKHVAQTIEADKEINIVIFDYAGNTVKYSATVLIKSEDLDVAVIYFDSREAYPAATIESGNSPTHIFSEVYSVSCPFGWHPIIVTGMISLTFNNSDPEDQTLYTVINGLAPGSSGGGLFNEETRELVGVMIATMALETEGLRIPITYCCQAVKCSEVKSWLKKKNLEYFYNVEVIASTPVMKWR